MNSAKRPIAVLFLSCLYIAVGTIGFVVNFPKLIALQHESIWIELTELLALIAGASRAKPRDLRFSGTLMDMFFDRPQRSRDDQGRGSTRSQLLLLTRERPQN